MTKGLLARISSRIGGSLFGILSGLEERGILRRPARWLKLSVLGLLVTLLGAPALKADDDIIMCYVPIEEPHLSIFDVSATPNPTAGKDTVTVKATAKLESAYYCSGDTAVSEAIMQLTGDTLLYPMKAVDGKFGDTLETVEGRLYVGDHKPETTWIYIVVRTNSGNAESTWRQLIITAPEADSNENKED